MATPASVLTDSMNGIKASNRLIVALDLASVQEAHSMVKQLDGCVHFFKIGLTLQLASGVEGLIKDLLSAKKKIFLDYKYYDIAATIRKTVARAANLGVSFLTVHGSSSIMKAAVEGRGASDLKLFTVTVLTSLDKDDMAEMGYPDHSVEQVVLFRTRKALEAGCDGVIASGHEVEAIKKFSNKLMVVTPGIRPEDHPEDDQKRRSTPTQAIKSGADYLVVGRPITEPYGATTSRQASEQILQEMQTAFDSMRTAE